MKYNKSNVMKTAWGIYRSNNGKMPFSAALKEAWWLTKCEARIATIETPTKATMKGSQKQIKWAQDIKQNIRNAIDNNNATWYSNLFEAFWNVVESMEYASDIIDMWNGMVRKNHNDNIPRYISSIMMLQTHKPATVAQKEAMEYIRHNLLGVA